jgi:pseudoazurin
LIILIIDHDLAEKVTMKTTRLLMMITASLTFFASSLAFAEEHVVNAEARIFKPDIIYIQPGDTVRWTNMTSHNAVTYVAPDGSSGFGEKGKLPGGSFSASPDKEGIYGYACEPHAGMGMVGVIVVGNATKDVQDAALKKADETLQGPFRRLMGTIKKVKVQ